MRLQIRFAARLALVATVAATAASAQEWALRDGDLPLSPDAMVARLIGGELEFYDGGRSRYAAGGAYSYTYSPDNGGGTAFGTYEFRDGGIVCTDFRNGFSRCDMFVENGERLLLLTEDGERYPVRPSG